MRDRNHFFINFEKTDIIIIVNNNFSPAEERRRNSCGYPSHDFLRTSMLSFATEMEFQWLQRKIPTSGMTEFDAVVAAENPYLRNELDAAENRKSLPPE